MIILRLLTSVASAIAHLLAILLKIIYNILKVFHIRLLALYLLACGIVHLCFHPFTGMYAAYFWLGLGLCLFVTVCGWIYPVWRRQRRERLKRERAAAERRKREEPKEAFAKTPQQNVKQAEVVPPKPNLPMLYEVEGHPDYVFTEYDDRYELFRRDGDGGYLYVRTDYKKGEV